MDKRTKERFLHFKRVFCSLNSERELAHLLKTDQRHLHILAASPRYRTFEVPKKNGGKRTIEDPYTELKTIMSRLNMYLQSVYYFERSRAAYGFILGVRNDDDRRNVLTNARKHIGRDYLMNIDLKNFFHTVTKEQVIAIFESKPFNFKRNLPVLLAELCTYNGRLPMGAPTSPTLSNLACRKLDEVLVQFAENMLWVYTRYADDMSFSSKQAFDSQKINSVRKIIQDQGFQVNEQKLKLYGVNDEKMVTGLVLTDKKVQLAKDYLPVLYAEIGRLKEIYAAQNEQGRLNTKWVEELKQQVRGRLNFAGFVMGKQQQIYIELKDAYYEAINPPEEEFGVISWRSFPYNI